MALDWSTAGPALLGALLGGSVPAILQLKASRQNRLEDAYIDFFGAAELLRTVSPKFVFEYNLNEEAEEYWVRFHHHRARLLLQEKDQGCQTQIERLTAAINDLYSTVIRIDGPVQTEEEIRKDQALRHLKNERTVRDELKTALDLARRRLQAE